MKFASLLDRATPHKISCYISLRKVIRRAKFHIKAKKQDVKRKNSGYTLNVIRFTHNVK
jgi:hypothetical protein